MVEKRDEGADDRGETAVLPNVLLAELKRSGLMVDAWEASEGYRSCPWPMCDGNCCCCCWRSKSLFSRSLWRPLRGLRESMSCTKTEISSSSVLVFVKGFVCIVQLVVLIRRKAPRKKRTPLSFFSPRSSTRPLGTAAGIAGVFLPLPPPAPSALAAPVLPTLFAYRCPKLLEYRLRGGIAALPSSGLSPVDPGIIPTPKLGLRSRLESLVALALPTLPLVPGLFESRPPAGSTVGGDGRLPKPPNPPLPAPIGEGGTRPPVKEVVRE